MYLFLLKSGPATLQNVSRETFIARSNCYYVVRRLISKGLIKKTLVNNKTAFVATGAESLKTMVDRQAELVDQVIPRLQSYLKGDILKPNIEVLSDPITIIERLNSFSTIAGLWLFGQKPSEQSIVLPLYNSITQSQIIPNSAKFIEKGDSDRYLILTADFAATLQLGEKPVLTIIHGGDISKTVLGAII
jgi:hypothetical protein